MLDDMQGSHIAKMVSLKSQHNSSEPLVEKRVRVIEQEQFLKVYNVTVFRLGTLRNAGTRPPRIYKTHFWLGTTLKTVSFV